jgi:hypothetical protein
LISESTYATILSRPWWDSAVSEEDKDHNTLYLFLQSHLKFLLKQQKLPAQVLENDFSLPKYIAHPDVSIMIFIAFG